MYKGEAVLYRTLTSLTDEEIIFIMKEIFDTDTVTNIVRFEEQQYIECDIHITDCEDGTPFYDTIELSEFDISTHDFIKNFARILRLL